MNQAIKRSALPGYDKAFSTPLADLDPSNPHLWPSQEMWAIFERLRNEDPLHYCKEAWMGDERPADMEPIGAYWSVTRYEDIMAIDTDHHRFSSDPAITLVNPAEDFPLPMFIAMDQPRHDHQRKAVQPAVAPRQLANLEPLIRQRVCTILDGLPVGQWLHLTLTQWIKLYSSAET